MSFSNKPLRGIIPPMVTPLAGEDELDRNALEKLIEHMIRGGVHGLFVCGTTGEGPSLSYRLRRELIRATCQHAKERIPVLVGILDTSKTEMLAMARFAAEAGAAAIVLAPPFYSPLSQLDLIRCVTTFASESPIPLYLYNLPDPRHVRYTLSTLKICAEIPAVIGFKDSSGNFEYLIQALHLFRDRPDFSIFVGPENLLSTSLAAGAHGGISGGANAFPHLYVALYDAVAENRTDDVKRLQTWIDRFTRHVYSIGEPESSLIRGLKCCLSILNLCDNRLCWPYTPANAEERAEIERSIRELVRDLIQILPNPRAFLEKGSSDARSPEQSGIR